MQTPPHILQKLKLCSKTLTWIDLNKTPRKSTCKGNVFSSNLGGEGWGRGTFPPPRAGAAPAPPPEPEAPPPGAACGQRTARPLAAGGESAPWRPRPRDKSKSERGVGCAVRRGWFPPAMWLIKPTPTLPRGARHRKAEAPPHLHRAFCT